MRETVIISPNNYQICSIGGQNRKVCPPILDSNYIDKNRVRTLAHSTFIILTRYTLQAQTPSLQQYPRAS